MKSLISADRFDAFLRQTAEVAPAAPGADVAFDCAALGQAWKKMGVRPGDLVFLSLPNGRELLHQFFGILMAGGVPALLTPMTPAARLREMAAEMGACAYAALRLPSGELHFERTESIGALRVGLFPPTEIPAAQSGEVVLLTSGTSGFSSGCVFDFENSLLNGQRHAESIGQCPDDVVLVSLPLNFSFAMVAQALGSFVCGNRLVIGGPPFHVPGYQKAITEFGVTISSLTPVLVRTLLQHETDCLAKLRVFSVGGDMLPPDQVADLLLRRHGGELYLTYGLTQAGPRVSTLAAHNEPPSRYTSCGRPLSGTRVHLREAPGGLGLQQLFVTSQTVMKRRIGRVEGRPLQEIAAPQTVATGDAFELDADGYLFYKGRLCDYINRKGEKISLAAVRRVAGQLPGVAAAKTLVVKDCGGAEDFDLELRMDASKMDALGDGAEMLRGVLRRAEMPRRVLLSTSAEPIAHRYK
jgi:acyl-CoA synthetase (AMP-forming)/AMP-acid ligase II